MQEQSTIKKILSTIKKYLLIIFLIIGNIIRSLFGKPKKDIKEELVKQESKTQPKEIKKETPISSNPTTLPDEDNIKTNPHNNISSTTEDTNPNTDIVLELPKQKLYKVYTKDNELKYLPLNGLLDLIIKEELERIYKVEKFKLKTATTSELIKVEKIKERVLPEIITRVENETLRNAEVIREEVLIKLEEDLIKNPLFPPRPTIKEENNEKKEIYTLAHPKKKGLSIKESTIPKLKKEETQTITTEQKDIISKKVDSINTVMVQLVDEIPTPSIKDNIKDAAIIGTVATAAIISEVTSTKKEPSTEVKQEHPTEEQKITQEESPKIIQEEQSKITQEELPKQKEELVEELKKIDQKDKKELEDLKKQVEQKIEEIKEEQKQIEKEIQTKEENTQKEVEQQKKQEHEISDVTEISNQIIEGSEEEIKKEDFFDKDYERIERQIDKMLEDLTNTYLKYDGKLSEKQKKKLKAEEQRLRDTKEKIRFQKNYDIQAEQKHLDETIKQSEIEGLEQELVKIHKENQQEVSNDLLGKMKRFEGMTAEQVANVDKRIMLKRFNKANILLEMTSLLALPFVRNKYFFYFTIGLVIDNHFNFVNAFFNRKYNRYNPVDLSQIKQGQDALNGALDVTYKNLVELEYLEQRALGRYPELAYDPRFVNQVTRLRTNLNKKYNNLMNKNKTLEKYRMKTKKQIKILKPKRKQDEQEAA